MGQEYSSNLGSIASKMFEESYKLQFELKITMREREWERVKEIKKLQRRSLYWEKDDRIHLGENGIIFYPEQRLDWLGGSKEQW